MKTNRWMPLDHFNVKMNSMIVKFFMKTSDFYASIMCSLFHEIM